MVHFADITFGVKLSRGQKLSQKEETLKDIVKAINLSEATHHLRHNINKIRNSSSSVSQFAVSSLPSYVTSLAPGCQNPRGFIYIVLAMVIRQLNENPAFFDHCFDPFSMSENKGSSVFQQLPEEVLVHLMNLVVSSVGLSPSYFKNFKEIKNYALEFKTFFSEIQSSPNPYKNLWEYERIFKEENLYESIRQSDMVRLQRLDCESAQEKAKHFALFLKNHSSEINTHQNAVSTTKNTRGFVYRMATLALIQHHQTKTPQEKEEIEKAIKIAHLNKNENKEMLLLMNDAAKTIGLGESYFPSFKEIESYCNEFITFYFYDVASLQGDYQACSAFVKSFIEQASGATKFVTSRAICSTPSTVALLTRRSTSNSCQQKTFLELEPITPMPVVHSQSAMHTQNDPGYILLIRKTHWFFQHKIKSLSLFLQDRKKMGLTARRLWSDVRRVSAYLIALLFPIFIQFVGWFVLENMAKNRKS